MSIMELGALGEFVASFGVIGTLVYLAVQMRQNTKAVRLNTAQTVTEELQAMFSVISSDAGMAEVMTEAGQNPELAGLSRVRYYTLTSSLMRVYENAYLQRREDAISDAHADSSTCRSTAFLLRRGRTSVLAGSENRRPNSA